MSTSRHLLRPVYRKEFKMICGKTKSGFTFAVNENAMNDMELVDLLADDDLNDAIKASKVVHKLLSDKQCKRLYDHVRTPEGRVPMDAISQEVANIFAALGKQGKNS